MNEWGVRDASTGGRPRVAWLFDVDGTLIRTEGAAREAFILAVRDVLGAEDDLAGVEFAGRTDRVIVEDILVRNARPSEPALVERFLDTVIDNMQDAFPVGRGFVLPGVTDLLAAIAQDPEAVITLLTGNTARMARLKLDRFGLSRWFVSGSFGDEAEHRDALACLAVERIHARYDIPATRCIIVGDTELDIQCARASGAHVVAVATGSRTRQDLEAYRPDLLLDDLTDTSALLIWAERITNGH